MRHGMIAAATLSLAGSVASAGLYEWTWNNGDTGSNPTGGEIQSITTTFDTANDMLSWSMTFADQISDGFTLALNDGPNPKGLTGELALMYFDATDLLNPVISVYGYNGQNGSSSYFDGVKGGGTIETPDRIATSLDAAFASTFLSISASDDAMAGTRTFEFVMDASVINNHSPLYPSTATWEGLAFDELLGVWLHPFKNLSTSYDGDGYLTDWSGTDGWLDGVNFQTELVPAPGSAALLALGGLCAARRRR